MKKQNLKKAFNVAMATTLAAGAVVAVAPTQTGAALSFSDVKETNSHYANILNLAERGVISGYEDGTFRPGDEIKRGNAAKIIAGVLGLDTTNVTNPGFKDVSTQNANYGAIAALANAGIINGFKEDGTYRPNATLTRGQMAKIIANAFKLSANGEESPFTDVQNSQYKENIAALFTNKVTTGVTATTFDAKSNVTRGQLASFVVRAENVQAVEEKDKEGILEETKVISAIRDSKVIVGNEELEVADELKEVFSASNASALDGAEVELQIEYTAETVASLVPVFAKAKGKIVGIKGLKLVKADTTFNPKGFSIPKISIGAAGVKLQEVKTAVLEVAKDSSVSIENVELTQLTLAEGAKADIKNSTVTSLDLATGAKVDLTGSKVLSLKITGDAKVTLDAATTLEKVIVEKGKTLADVISNYEEVKEALKNVVVVDTEGAEVTPVAPPTSTSTPDTGTGTGTGTGTDKDKDKDKEPTFEEKTETYLNEVISTLNGITVGNAVVTADPNTITITASESLTKTELSNVQLEIMGNFYGLGTTAIVSSVTIDGTSFNAESLTDSNFEDNLAASMGDTLGLSLKEANNIKGATAEENILTYLTDSVYTGTVTLNLIDGKEITFTVQLVKN